MTQNFFITLKFIKKNANNSILLLQPYLNVLLLLISNDRSFYLTLPFYQLNDGGQFFHVLYRLVINGAYYIPFLQATFCCKTCCRNLYYQYSIFIVQTSSRSFAQAFNIFYCCSQPFKGFSCFHQDNIFLFAGISLVFCRKK